MTTSIQSICVRCLHAVAVATLKGVIGDGGESVVVVPGAVYCYDCAQARAEALREAIDEATRQGLTCHPIL